QLATPLGVEDLGALRRSRRHGTPQIVEHALLVLATLARAFFFGAKIEILLARITVDAMRHQGMRGIERDLDREPAIALLALGDIALGEIQIVEDTVGVGPLPEQ